MQYKYAEIADTVYFWFAANATTGAAGDGATPLYDVRLAGAAANAAPVASGTPTLLSHADYTDGLFEIAIDTTGYSAGEYAVFCTLTISTVNPAGFCGSFKLSAAGASLNSVIGLLTHADYGLAKLVRSTTPANTLAVGATGLVAVPDTQKVDVETIKTRAVTCAAGVTVLANLGFAGAPGANNGAPTTNGTKINQTADLTSGQSIACSDKTGFALTVTPPTAAEIKTAMEADGSKLDHLWEMTEDDGGTRRLTTNSLEQAPTGGSAPTAAAIADAVWDEAISGHLGAGSTGNALNAAGNAGDPWSTPIPGAYGAGTAGKILGDNVNAPIATIDTVVDAIKSVVDNIHDTDLPAVKTVVDTIQADTDLLDDAAGGIADIHTDIGTLQSMLTDIHGTDLPAVKTVVDGIEVHVHTTIPALIPSAADIKTAVEAAGSHLTLIKAKTDKMTYTSGDDLDVNVQKINDVTLAGDGSGTPMGAV